MAELDLQRLRSQLLLQRREVVIGAVLLVVSLGLLVLGAMPLWTRYQVVDADVRRERGALQRIQQRAALLSGISPEEQQQFRQVAQALPLGKQPLVVLQSLEAIAADTEVSLGKYDLNPGIISTQTAETTSRTRSRRNTSQVQTLPVSVEIIGSFEAIQATMEEIEQSLPVMEVVEMSLNPERQVGFSTPTTSYIASLLIQGYFAPLDSRELARQGASALTRAQQSALEVVLGMSPRLSSTPEAQGPVPEFDNPNLFGGQEFVGPTLTVPTPVPTPQGAPTPPPAEAGSGPEVAPPATEELPPAEAEGETAVP